MISSSGPTRKVAPRFFASAMLAAVRARLPAKSSAHWFSAHVATVAVRPMARLRRRGERRRGEEEREREEERKGEKERRRGEDGDG